MTLTPLPPEWPEPPPVLTEEDPIGWIAALARKAWARSPSGTRSPWLPDGKPLTQEQLGKLERRAAQSRGIANDLRRQTQ